MDGYENRLTPKYYMMEIRYDKPNLYSNVYHAFHSQAIIPINWKNTKIPPEGISWNGQLICTIIMLMSMGGDYNGFSWCTSSPSIKNEL